MNAAQTQGAVNRLERTMRVALGGAQQLGWSDTDTLFINIVLDGTEPTENLRGTLGMSFPGVKEIELLPMLTRRTSNNASEGKQSGQDEELAIPLPNCLSMAEIML